MIDDRADIHPSAKIADNVKIGPWTVIGPEVEIGEGTVIESHVVIKGPVKIGKNNRIFQFASFDEPQDKKFQGEDTLLEIGDDNVIREYCTLNRGTVQGGGVTKIGNGNLFMAYAHVAHDCIIGNHNIFANNASLAGHVIVNDYVGISGFAGIHQFCRIGAYSFVGKASYVGKDVLPYVLVSGYDPDVYGLNTVGLKRRGFTNETIEQLKKAYRVIYRRGLTIKQALAELADMIADCPEIGLFVEAIENSERGILR